MNNNLTEIVNTLIDKYAKNELNNGLKYIATHVYDDGLNNISYIRIRLKHPDSEKWIRPFHLDSAKNQWVQGEPKFNGKKVLYHLKALKNNSESPVWIVEGEQKVDALEKLGLTATTSGGSSTARTVNWEPLRNRKIIIWRDYDDAGIKYTKDLLEILESLDCCIECIDVDALNLQSGDDIIDWLEKNHTATKQTLIDLPLIKDLSIYKNNWSEPLPLTAVIKREPYPLDSLPIIIRDAIKEVQSYTKAPVPLVTASAISAISLACQTYIDVKRDNKLNGPTSLFFITIADSGERKSTCDNLFTKSIYEYEKKQHQNAKPLIKDYQAKLNAWQAKYNGVKNTIKKLTEQGENTQLQEDELINLEHIKPESPIVPKIIYNDVTPEALNHNLATVWPSAGIVSSEGGVIFGGHGMNKDSVMRNLATYNQGWDGKGISTDRRTSESFGQKEVRLSMAIQVQEATLREFISRFGSLARGIGYFARVLFSWPESTQGTRLFTEAPDIWTDLERFNKQISEILNQPAPIDNNGILTPKIMELAPEAKSAWIKAHDDIEIQLHKSGELSDIKDVASKAADNIARLAALISYFESNGNSNKVALSAINTATSIILWHLNESKYFFNELSLSPELANANHLEKWLIHYCKENNTNIVKSSIVMQYGPQNLRKSAAITATVNELQKLNRANLNKSDKPNYIEINPYLLN
tara:strand:- start:3121 stop:5217 length:2097 start_codon:yes stop_codon:yes gene_type:complete